MYSKHVSYTTLKEHHDPLHRTVFFKLLELRDYANPHIRKHYFPEAMTRKQMLEKAEALFNTDGLDATQLHPYLIQSAVIGREYELAQLLMEKGINLHCYSQADDSNFLSTLTLSPDTDIDLRDQTLETLLLAGADANQGKTHPDADESGSYPLNYAVGNCDYRMAELLLRYQANPNLKTAREAFFPVFNVCSGRRDYAPEKTVMMQNPEPASTSNLKAMLALLLAYGADPNTIFHTDDTRIDADANRQAHAKRTYACQGKLPQARSLYDFYLTGAQRHHQAGLTLQAGEYENAAQLIAEQGGKPLKALCQH